MATRDTIVIGASAGGVQALITLVAALPSNLPAAVFIVLHIPADSPSLLPDILARESGLPVGHAKNTGARDDGTTGMRAIKQRGGITIVQDPIEATFPSMPTSVMRDITVDYSLPLRAIGPLLDKLSRHTADEEGGFPLPEDVEIENRIAGQEMDAGELIANVERLGKVSRLTCPDCHGALWEINDEDTLRFRCHVGHAHSADSLNNGQSLMLEGALWSAIRALEEQMSEMTDQMSVS